MRGCIIYEPSQWGHRQYVHSSVLTLSITRIVDGAWKHRKLQEVLGLVTYNGSIRLLSIAQLVLFESAFIAELMTFEYAMVTTQGDC